MAGDKVICTTNDVKYSTIRKAMCGGVRTQDELVEATGVCTTCEGCESELDNILTSVCGCKGTSLEEVVSAVKDGANTVDKVMETTGAGTDCGRCKALIENVIEIGR